MILPSRTSCFRWRTTIGTISAGFVSGGTDTPIERPDHGSPPSIEAWLESTVNPSDSTARETAELVARVDARLVAQVAQAHLTHVFHEDSNRASQEAREKKSGYRGDEASDEGDVRHRALELVSGLLNLSGRQKYLDSTEPCAGGNRTQMLTGSIVDRESFASDDIRREAACGNPFDLELGDDDLSNGRGAGLDARPQAKSFENAAGSMVERQGPVVEAGLGRRARRHGLEDRYPQPQGGQGAGQAGADQPATGWPGVR